MSKEKGPLHALGNFLFGKNPDIFDENGEVRHVHPKKKWDLWQNRFKNNPDLNWRQHSGTESPAKK